MMLITMVLFLFDFYQPVFEKKPPKVHRVLTEVSLYTYEPSPAGLTLLGLRERSSDLEPGRETWRPDRGEARQHGRQPGCAPLARLPATRSARSFAQAASGESSPEFHLPFDAILKRCRPSLLVAG